MDDKTLLRVMEENPDRGIALMVRIHREPLRAAVSQYLTNARDIKECVEDTFADFYLQRGRFDPSRGSLRGYLVTIAQRKAFRRYHEEQRQWNLVLNARTTPADINEWEQRDYLETAIRDLPELDQRILHLRYFEDRTLREIAGELGLEYEAVKKRVQRALAKLIRRLEE